MLESAFKNVLIDKIRELCRSTIYIIKPDPSQRSMPDLILLGPNGRWAALEIKRGPLSDRRPNQEFHIGMMDVMSYAKIVHPENMREILDDLERLFTS